MNRLTNSVSQKHLRSLAIKHGMQNAAPSEKIDSPLIKVNPNGSITCVICRSNLKSVSLWKVHINSKTHKSNVKEAKEIKDKILNSKLSTVTQSVHQTLPNIEKNSITTHVKETKSNTRQDKHGTADKIVESSIKTVACDKLPEEFFDISAAEAIARHEEINAAEWEQFQREIQEVSRVSHEIFVNDQKNLAVEREIVEINEQLQHWSKVLELENKREKLHVILDIKKVQRTPCSDHEESSEDEAFEEYPDWRSKGFK